MSDDNMFINKTVSSSFRSLRQNWIDELTKLETKQIQLHGYIQMKLDEHDYHAIADAAMDLRELDARSKAIKEWLES